MKAKIDRQASRKLNVNSLRVMDYEGSFVGSGQGSKGRGADSEGEGGKAPSVVAPSESCVSGASSVYIKGARSKKPI